MLATEFFDVASGRDDKAWASRQHYRRVGISAPSWLSRGAQATRSKSRCLRVPTTNDPMTSRKPLLYPAVTGVLPLWTSLSGPAAPTSAISSGVAPIKPDMRLGLLAAQR